VNFELHKLEANKNRNCKQKWNDSCSSAGKASSMSYIQCILNWMEGS